MSQYFFTAMPGDPMKRRALKRISFFFLYCDGFILNQKQLVKEVPLCVNKILEYYAGYGVYKNLLKFDKSFYYLRDWANDVIMVFRYII